MIKFTLTPWINHLLTSMLVIFVAFLIFRLLRFLLSRFLNRSSAHLKVDPTNYTFLKNALNLIVVVITVIIILYTIPGFKQIGLTLFASAGIFAAILGFASQAAFSNIISGIFIVIFKPFSVGDVIRVGNDEYGGTIEDITLRHTVIKDFENKRYVVPNSIVSEQVIRNFTLYDQRIANFVIFNISFESDLDKASRILQEEAEKHPLIREWRTPEDVHKDEPLVRVRVVEITDFAVRIRATCWTDNNSEGFVLKTDLLRSVKLRFDAEGIEIPFPHRTIVNKKNGQTT